MAVAKPYKIYDHISKKKRGPQNLFKNSINLVTVGKPQICSPGEKF